jgi:lysophospholipase L1-like esterase
MGGGSGGSGGSAGSATGGTSGMCVRDQISPSEVVFIGDSFIALGNNIPTALQADARAAGSLGQNETYRNNAVSGTLLGNGQIPGQYNSAVTASPVKVVLMNGGGNDCLQANNPDPAYTAAVSLFQSMAQRGTEYVIYFFYPDPLGSFAGGSLKTCLDGLRPRMKTLCDGLTSPKCFFIDLRPGWDSSHTSDGIHTTAAGGKFVADKVWAVMQQNCIAQ